MEVLDPYAALSFKRAATPVNSKESRCHTAVCSSRSATLPISYESPSLSLCARIVATASGWYLPCNTPAIHRFLPSIQARNTVPIGLVLSWSEYEASFTLSGIPTRLGSACWATVELIQTLCPEAPPGGLKLGSST